MNYKIVEEEYTYGYRSYMACEDNTENDCFETRTNYIVFNKNRQLKTFSDRRSAREYVRKLKSRK